MIFDGKPIYKISDKEIHQLIEKHIGERQHLEYKITYDNKDDKNKVEILRDICSLANGGGGYLIIGIRDDGKGNAQKYEPEMIGNPDKIKKSIASLTNDYISERIEGLEVNVKNINKNPLVIIRVPVSDRIPHMVTYQNKTDFYTRYHDGKREMTFGEIKEAFMKDPTILKLSKFEILLNTLFEDSKCKYTQNDIQSDDKIKKPMVKPINIDDESLPNISLINDGNIVNYKTMEIFEQEVKERSYFRISVTPKNAKTNLIDVNDKKIKHLFENPPESREFGWNMKISYSNLKRYSEGIFLGDKKYSYLELLTNGHMEFWKTIDMTFCWKQSEEEFKIKPRMYPYPVVEYTVSFLRLYKSIIDYVEIEDDLYFSIAYKNIKGFFLYPGSPNSYKYHLYKMEPYPKLNFKIREDILKSDYNPDKVTFNILSRLYGAFGYTDDAIPFYNKEENKFFF